MCPIISKPQPLKPTDRQAMCTLRQGDEDWRCAQPKHMNYKKHGHYCGYRRSTEKKEDRKEESEEEQQHPRMRSIWNTLLVLSRASHVQGKKKMLSAKYSLGRQ